MNVKFIKGDWGGRREHGFRLVLAWPDVARPASADATAWQASQCVKKWPMADGQLPKGVYESYDNYTNLTSIFPGRRHCMNQALILHEPKAARGVFFRAHEMPAKTGKPPAIYG